MQDIKMVDLKGQHDRIRGELDAALEQVISTTAFIRGPQVAAFEKSLAVYLQCRSVIGCANGTDALQLALMALKLPIGSEVITSDFTFVATAEMIALLGFVPVLVDIDPHTFTLSPDAVLKAITPNTKAIIPVHLFGQCADMESLLRIAKDNGLYIIEDNAQALGADFIFSDGSRQKAGTIGQAGTTSFFPAKNLGCMGDGGAVMTNDADMARQMTLAANHGMDEQYLYEEIGINSRLDTLQAAILEVKLRHLDDYNSARRKAAAAYTERLQGIDQLLCPQIASYSTHIFHQYTLRILNGRRDALMQHLNAHGIPAKIYYPVPLHEHKPYRRLAHYDEQALTNTKLVSGEVLSLPMHTELSIPQIDYITDIITQYLNK
jgi:dTDP-4-amino-4,6-dideoxygalactose transaminase